MDNWIIPTSEYNAEATIFTAAVWALITLVVAGAVIYSLRIRRLSLEEKSHAAILGFMKSDPTVDDDTISKEVTERENTVASIKARNNSTLVGVPIALGLAVFFVVSVMIPTVESKVIREGRAASLTSWLNENYGVEVSEYDAKSLIWGEDVEVVYEGNPVIVSLSKVPGSDDKEYTLGYSSIEPVPQIG